MTKTKVVMAGLVPAIHESIAARSVRRHVFAMECAWIYIVTNQPNGTLYTGVTSDLARRAYEHREGLVEGFTKRYGLKRLVYVEPHNNIAAAIQRERNIKHWPRKWKVRLILTTNPAWDDLYEQLL
ncbi:MAG TPA: GIY-YIG nuclease family protein [Stellaceae bacterium]|nr:GIY-YIG nuclease family protein [Stellaceae bacterium]